MLEIESSEPNRGVKEKDKNGLPCVRIVDHFMS